MARLRVTWVKLGRGDDAVPVVAGIGGPYLVGGSGWYEDAEDAIAEIERGESRFYVSLEGRDVALVVGSRGGRKFLKTELDGERPDTLLGLPDEPGRG